MQLLDNKLIFSATDLSSFLACPHLTLLSHRALNGGPQKPFHPEDPGVEVVRQRGREHEQKYLAGQRGGGAAGQSEKTVVDLTSYSGGHRSLERLEGHVTSTLDAMRSGADLIYQGALFDGTWLGYPDFLRRVERPSRLGGWSYEVVDTKLAREAKGGALLQILLYAELLADAQGVWPEYVHLALGGPEAANPRFRVNDYTAYFRSIKQRFLTAVANRPERLPLAVDPVTHCALCDWDTVCEKERRDVDHLDFVAGISRGNRRALAEHGITTLEGLAAVDVKKQPKLDGLSPATLVRIQHQARLQQEARTTDQLRYELLKPMVENQGLAALPPPSPGDLFFDLEGDPYAFDIGIEYLFGVADADDKYVGRWSLDRPAEKATFEWFMDFVTERLNRWPDLHIYHYAAYEPTALKKLAVRHDASGSPELAALKRLAGRYDTRIEELDRLLRGRVFVDLYSVVKQSLRASVESYSIKKMEAFYNFERKVDMRAANQALGNFEAWLNLGGKQEDGQVLLQQIEDYNRDDVLSTHQLRDWLEGLRSQLGNEIGAVVPRPSYADPEPPKELTEKIKEVRDLMERLLVGIPADVEQRTADQQSYWLMAQMLEWHRRENKSFWWQYYAWQEKNQEQLMEDRTALACLEYAGEVGSIRKSVIHRYRYPMQDHRLSVGDDTRDPTTQSSPGKVHAIDEISRTIDLVRGKTSKVAHPVALIPYEYVSDILMRERLLQLGKSIANNGLDREHPFHGAVDLLRAAPPRVGQKAGQILVDPGKDVVEEAQRLVLALDHSVLPIQGPPGAGKTYTAAHMILALLTAGKKVGVTATSHKVISNLLSKICEEATRLGQSVRGIQKASEEQHCGAGQIVLAEENEEVLNALTSGEIKLAAGTAWLWCRNEMAGVLDVLFVDEAGQFSLANALAVAPAAKNLVLLGDPQQLQQPSQGLHPPGSTASALEHLLGGNETMPGDRGIFLDQTWRLHPDICDFTSELYYESRLKPHAGMENQRINWTGDAKGTGLRWNAVGHQGNQSESPEEVAVVRDLVTRLLNDPVTWTDDKGNEKPLTLKEILVVSPYNAQVGAIADALPPGARVGTVDKFQGQEAPLVIYSMATSTPQEAPRGMEFLYSPNRFNVATSRARCLIIVVANGQLLLPECRTPDQMRLANGLCRYFELAATIA